MIMITIIISITTNDNDNNKKYCDIATFCRSRREHTQQRYYGINLPSIRQRALLSL